MTTISIAPAQAAKAALNPRIRRLIEEPILPTLLKLTAPNLADAAARVAFLTLDAYFVSFLGSDALAGVALVFPFFLLMQTMAAGAMGGGVSAAVARALGAGRQDDANALVAHAVVIALVMAALFSLIFILAGPALYRAMGARDGVLDAAVTYSLVVFSGGVFIWTTNILINVVRGTGAMMMAAAVVVINEIVHVACAPVLILGFGSIPSLGVAGAGIGVVASYAAGTLVLIAYLASRRAAVWFTHARFERRLFDAILSVGALSSINTLQNQALYIVLSILAASFGGAALAGYGAAVRLEMTLMPLVFTVGAASVAMIGANMGAGETARAVRTAWTAAAIGAVIAGSVGLLGALFAPRWMALFTSDPQISAIGASYLVINGPMFAVFGAGSALFFASQGLGSVGGPLLAISSRLVLLVAFGWLIMPAFGLGLREVFIANAASMVWVGVTITLVFWVRSRKVAS
jgi:putative MATE family efflux protein